MVKTIKFNTYRNKEQIQCELSPLTYPMGSTKIVFKVIDYRDFFIITDFIKSPKDPIVKECVTVFYDRVLDSRRIRDCKHKFGVGRPRKNHLDNNYYQICPLCLGKITK